MDLGTVFCASVVRAPYKLAFVDGATRVTYGEWYEDIRRLAGGLSSLGLGRGDHLFCTMRNRYEMATLYWACQMLAAVFTPFNWRATKKELEFVIQNAEPKIVAFDDSCEKSILPAIEFESFEERMIVTTDEVKIGTKFSYLLMAEPVAGPVGAKDSDTCLMLYTSGTTGQPKGVPRSQAAERTAAASVIGHLSYKYGYNSLCVMPLFHTMGIRVLLCTTMINGALINMRSFKADMALNVIEAENVNALFLVPTMLHDILYSPNFNNFDTSSVRNVAYAGMAMMKTLERRCVELLKPEVFANYYGSSEIFTFTVCDHLDEKAGCAGRPGINQMIRIVRADIKEGGQPEDILACNEIGEVIASMKSPEAFRGYWKRPDADKKAIRGDWYFTGDLGYLDKDGELFLCGRIDDMIISGGENIHPEEVEDTLRECDLVDEVAVIGTPDHRWGQKVVAFVLPAKKNVTPAALDHFCTESALARFKRPRSYVFVESLPKSASGKLLRRMLRDVDDTIT